MAPVADCTEVMSDDNAALLARLEESTCLEDARRLARSDIATLTAQLKERGFKIGHRMRLQQILSGEAEVWTDMHLDVLRAEHFADDLDLSSHMRFWSKAELERYWESGGTEAPSNLLGAVSSDGAEIESAKTRGNSAVKEGRDEEAIACYTRALALDPRREHGEAAALLANRALALLRTHRYRECIADCTGALELQPQYGKASLRRAKAREAMGELDDALGDAKAAAALDRSKGSQLYVQRLEQQVAEKKQCAPRSCAHTSVSQGAAPLQTSDAELQRALQALLAPGAAVVPQRGGAAAPELQSTELQSAMQALLRPGGTRAAHGQDAVPAAQDFNRQVAMAQQRVAATQAQARAQAQAQSEEQAAAGAKTAPAAAAAVAAAAHPLAGDADYSELLDAIGEAQFVLLGESTHGTAEFYDYRAALTLRLIAERGFNIVLCEADWPMAHRINRYIGTEGSMDSSAAEALADFDGFPRWMWRNPNTARLAEELRAHNTRVQDKERDRLATLAAAEEMKAAGATAEQMESAGLCAKDVEAAASGKWRPVAFYGMDLYSVNASARAVIDFLEIVDPDAADAARANYAVLAAYDSMHEYGQQVAIGELVPMAQQIEDSVLATLGGIQRCREAYSLVLGAAEQLSAEQNAQVVVSGEAYFRGLYLDGDVATWNLRDQHMVQTCLRLVEHHTLVDGSPPRVLIWAHNSHCGDARATHMGTQRHEWNLGQMMRTTFGASSTFICGFGTYVGTVTAAPDWGKPHQTFDLTAAEDGSYSDVMHRALPALRNRVGDHSLNAFLLLLKQREGDDERQRMMRTALQEPRRQRAVGVSYKQAQQAVAHYFQASLSLQCDAWVHVDRSTALAALA